MTERHENAVGFRRDPFGELDLFERWSPFGRGLASPWRLLGGAGGAASVAQTWAPAVDIAEDDESFVVTAEVPGAKPEDVTVEVHEGVLTLRGEKKSEREEKREHARYVERTYGSFSRSFRLPDNADGERVGATFKDGVLSLQIPKREEAKPRTVHIQS
jgi:HSP20 family protein